MQTTAANYRWRDVTWPSSHQLWNRQVIQSRAQYSLCPLAFQSCWIIIWNQATVLSETRRDMCRIYSHSCSYLAFATLVIIWLIDFSKLLKAKCRTILADWRIDGPTERSFLGLLIRKKMSFLINSSDITEDILAILGLLVMQARCM